MLFLGLHVRECDFRGLHIILYRNTLKKFRLHSMVYKLHAQFETDTSIYRPNYYLYCNNIDWMNAPIGPHARPLPPPP